MSKIALEPIDAKHDQDAVDMESIWSALRKTLYRNHKSTPSMVLSVIGDSDSLVPRHWAKNVFQTALIEAAKSGGETWILYQGNGKGVSNLVRNAYLDYEVLEFGIKTVDISDSDRHIKLISIAEEKGIVYQEMKTETGPSHLKIALTTPEWNANQGEGEGTFLVDFGIFVSEQRSSFFGLNMDFKMPIPFAIIVCEGDIGTITYISKALQNNIPVIIMKGSGKVADLIVDFLNNPVGLIVKATILFGIDLNDTKFVQLEEFFQRIEKNRHIIGLFDLDQDNPLKLSSIIGDSIVNCGSRKPRSIKDVQEQLSTSKYFQQSCPRFSITEKKRKSCSELEWKIFDQYGKGTMNQYVLNPEYSTTTSLPLYFYFGYQMVEEYNMMEQYGPVLLFEALKVNRCDYVSSLLDRGVKFNKDDIFKLYQQKVSCKGHAFADMDSLNLLWILKKIQLKLDILRNSTTEEYFRDFMYGNLQKNRQKLHNIVTDTTKQFCCEILNYKEHKTEKNLDDDMIPNILLWAILFNRRELAEILWLRSKNHLYIGLVCSAILKTLSATASEAKEQFLKNDMEEHSKLFQQRCVDLMDGMSIENMNLSISLMDTKAVIWGIHSSPLSIAHEHEMYDVVAHTCSVNSMNRQWYNNEHLSLKSLPKAVFTQPIKLLLAPVTKYLYNQILYVFLLVMYSTFVLTSIGVKYSVQTYLIDYYVLILSAGNLLETLVGIAKLKTRNSFRKSLYTNMKNYFGDPWNVMDMMSYLLLIIGLLVRHYLGDERFTAARRLFSLSLLFMYLKFFQVFLIHRRMGITIIMIKEMLKDLYIFLAIDVLLMIGVGVYYHANLWPDHKQMWSGGWTNWRIWTILYYPYWQLFGEINLGVLEGSEHENCSDVYSIWESDPSIKRCPQEDWTVPLITAIYMLFSNILLVNLVIAMFSYTFARVQENSEKMWHYQMYTVIRAYKWRIPSPINMLMRPIIYLVYWIKVIACCQNKVMDSSGSNNNEIAFRSEFQRIVALRNHRKIK